MKGPDYQEVTKAKAIKFPGLPLIMKFNTGTGPFLLISAQIY